LAQLGAFAEPAALLFGQVPAGAPLASPGVLAAILDDVLPPGARYPVVAGVSCGHLSPMLSIPLYRPARLELDGAPRLLVGQDRAGEPVRVAAADALAQSVDG